MRRLYGLVLAATMACATAVVPADAAPRVQRVTFVLRRTTPGPSSYELNISIQNRHSSPSFLGSVAARFERGRPVTATASWAGSQRRWEDTTLHANGTTVRACQAGVCHDDSVAGYQGLGTTHIDDGGADAPTHFFYVAVGEKVDYEFRGKGWRLIRTPLSYRYLDGGDTSKLHGHAGAFGAEAYTDASLPGGRYGSLGVGVPPCSMASVGVARGAGTLTLDGGAKSESVVCPGLPKLIASYATRATKWRLHGTAVGETTNQDTRLFVVDLPARVP